MRGQECSEKAGKRGGGGKEELGEEEEEEIHSLANQPHFLSCAQGPGWGEAGWLAGTHQSFRWSWRRPTVAPVWGGQDCGTRSVYLPPISRPWRDFNRILETVLELPSL